MATLLALIGVWGACTYAPWMASFTETVERRNPALTATGLAIWGWILRVIVAVAFLVLPHIVNSVTPLVDSGAQVQAVDTQLAKEFPLLHAELHAHQQVFQTLAKYPNANDIPHAVLNNAIKTVGAPTLQVASSPKAAKLLDYLGKHAGPVTAAQAKAPHQWRHWLWVCTGGAILFIPFIFLMAGYWRPERAREDLERKEQAILAGAGPNPVGGSGTIPSPSNPTAVRVTKST
jgi:hypothetical protein